MDTRTSPARLNIERIRDGARSRRLRRRADPVERSAPLGIPARALAGPAVGLGLHRLGRHPGDHARPRRALRRQPLLGAGRARARRQRHRAGEDAVAGCARYHIEWLCQQRRPRRDRRGRRRRARPRRRPPAAGRARALRRQAAQRPRRPRRRLAGAAGDADRARSTSTPRPKRPSRAAERLRRVRAAMREAGATHHFVSTVDDLAWILNLRGADVSYNPVFLAHLLIAPDTATLFIAAAKVDARLCRHPRRRRRAPRALRAGRRRARRPARERRPAARSEAGDARHARARPGSGGRGDQSEHPRQEQEERRRSGARAPGDGRGRRGDVRVLRLVRGGAGRSVDRRRRSPS